MHNSQLEDTLKEFNLFTSRGIRTWNLLMWNKKRVVLRMTAPSIGCTVKGIILFLRLLHNSIEYWA